MIYYKLDWYACMIYNRSVSFCLNKLGIYNDFVDQIMESGQFGRGHTVGEGMTFSFNGVIMSIEKYQFIRILEEAEGDIENFVDQPCDSIRIELTGKGLDWLRSGITTFNPDLDLTKFDFWDKDPSVCNVKRCDFAFDFVNCREDFLLKFHDFLSFQEKDGYLSGSSVRLRLLNNRCGINYEQRWSSRNKTLYLGSPKSNSLLRIYDKFLEQSKYGVLNLDNVPKVFCEKELDGILNSWIRIELQTRDEIAQFLLFQPDSVIDSINNSGVANVPYIESSGDLSYVLRYIFNRYMVLDENREIPQFLLDLYDWDTLPALIPHTLYYVQLEKPTLTRIKDYIFGQVFSSLYALMAYEGVDSFLDQFIERMKQIQLSDDPVLIRKRQSADNKLLAILTETQTDFKDCYIDRTLCGGRLVYEFKDPKYQYKKV